MAGKKREPIGKGSAVKVTDRLWALVDTNGRLVYDHFTDRPSIYSTRSHAEQTQRQNAEYTVPTKKLHVVRLDDITGTVYR